MASSETEKDMKILDAHTARVLQLERIDGERACAELKKHLVENEAILFAHNNHYFTNFGRIIRITLVDSKILSKFDGISVCSKLRYIPILPVKEILKIDNGDKTLRELALVSSTAGTFHETRDNLGISEEEAVNIRATLVNGTNSPEFPRLVRHLSADEAILYRTGANYFTNKGRGFVARHNNVYILQLGDAVCVKSTNCKCDMPESLVRGIMSIKHNDAVMRSLVIAAESIKLVNKQSTGEKRKRTD